MAVMAGEPEVFRNPGMKRNAALFFLIAVSFFLSVSCGRNRQDAGRSDKLRVVTTLFPLYDFTRNIGGDKVDVALILPPGMESHSFDPKPEDIVRINKADIFVYTNRYMEPWAADIINGLDSRKTLVIDSSRNAKFLKAGRGQEHTPEVERGPHKEESGHHDGEGMDPHLWLDFANAQIMVDNILAGLTAKDPKNRDYYAANAAAFKAKLADLDKRFRVGLAACGKRVILHGGHFAFGYLADRYGLRYESAYAITADSEPSPARVVELIRLIRTNGLHHVYTEELIEPRVADTIARETGATVLKLNGAHNIGRDDLANGATFLSLMDENLKNLRVGLQCR
jgi:zinc transport system substrate-binding protein